jgi:hypothetical protein
MTRIALIAASIAALGLASIQTASAQVIRGGGHGDRGAFAGQAHDRTGPNGGRIAGARGAVTDGQGNGAAGGVNCARGPNGSAGCRAGATTRTADGAAQHQSGMHAEGAKGRELTSAGAASKTADGYLEQGRTTTATGENGSVSVTGAYDSANGRSRTVTCTDATGVAVACPQ